MDRSVAGIDIGGTKISIAVASLDGKILSKRRIPTHEAADPYTTVEHVSAELEEMLFEADVALAGIGVCSPAPIDVQRGLIMSPSNLPDWVDFPLVELLRTQFAVPVSLDNDANAAALGEFIYGAGRGHKNIFYLTVSTGIGGGMIINGELYRGTLTSAGEIGHTIVQPDGILCNCGSRGCLETLCSGIHIARRAREQVEHGIPSSMTSMVESPEHITAKTVVEAVKKQDPLAIKIWEGACRYLAIGIANAITLLAPEAVVIGGGISLAGELLFSRLREQVPGFVSMVPAAEIDIVPAELGTDSGTWGAIALAVESLNYNLKSTNAA